MQSAALLDQLHRLQERAYPVAADLPNYDLLSQCANTILAPPCKIVRSGKVKVRTEKIRYNNRVNKGACGSTWLGRHSISLDSYEMTGEKNLFEENIASQNTVRRAMSRSELLRELHRPNTPQSHFYARQHIRTCCQGRTSKVRQEESSSQTTPVFSRLLLRGGETSPIGKLPPSPRQQQFWRQSVATAETKKLRRTKRDSSCGLNTSTLSLPGLITRNRYECLMEENTSISMDTLSCAPMRKRLGISTIKCGTRHYPITDKVSPSRILRATTAPATVSGGSAGRNCKNVEIQADVERVKNTDDPDFYREVRGIEIDLASRKARRRPQHRMAIDHVLNCLDDPDETRPHYFANSTIFKPVTIENNGAKWCGLAEGGQSGVVVDVTMLSILRRHAVFQIRDVKLLQSLKMRAERYLADFDMAQADPAIVTRMLTDTVAAAMIPSHAEMMARRFLTHRGNQFRMDRMNEFLTGKTKGLISTYYQKVKANLLGHKAGTALM